MVIFFLERTYVLLKHHLGWTKQIVLGKKKERFFQGRFLFIHTVKRFTIIIKKNCPDIISDDLG